MLTIYSITPTPRQSAADIALSAAVDRFLPNPEPHELQFIRDELRARGHDVLPLVRSEHGSELANSVAWLAGLLEDACRSTHTMHDEEEDALGQARALLDRVRRAKS